MFIRSLILRIYLYLLEFPKQKNTQTQVTDIYNQ